MFYLINEEYAATLLLWGHEAKGWAFPKTYSTYYEYEAKVKNPREIHLRLLEEGYLRKPTLYEALNALTVDALKSHLEDLNLKKTGKKAELISRLMDSLDDSLAHSIVNSCPLYFLSESGEDFLAQHIDYVGLHQHWKWGIQLGEYYECRKKYGSYPNFIDIALEIQLSKKPNSVSQHGCNYYYSLERYYDVLSEIYELQHKCDKALLCLLTKFLLELDGTSYLSWCALSESPTTYAKDEIWDSYSCSLFTPGVVSRIANLRDYYNSQMLAEIYAAHERPYKLCSEECFQRILSGVFAANPFIPGLYLPELKNQLWKLLDRYGVPETRESLGDICTRHPYIRAAGMCVRCQKLFCKDCLIKVSERNYCIECVAEMQDIRKSDASTFANNNAASSASPTAISQHEIGATSSKSKVFTLLLCTLGGFLGLHNFYAGKTKAGILYLFTFGIFGMGWIIDIFKVLSGTFTDGKGLLINK